MTPFWSAVLTWAAALFTVACGVASALLLRRQRRTMRRLQELWTDEAPSVGPVEIVLHTGDTIAVQPTDLHKQWVWFVPIPVDQEQIDYVTLPELPPWTSLVPVPKDTL